MSCGVFDQIYSSYVTVALLNMLTGQEIPDVQTSNIPLKYFIYVISSEYILRFFRSLLVWLQCAILKTKKNETILISH